MKFSTALKLVFIIGFLFIHKTEISFLPTPLTSVNTILGSKLTLIPFLLLLLFIFSVIPCTYFVSIVLWCVKYQIIHPMSFPEIFRTSMGEFLKRIIDSFLFLTIFWCFNMPYEPEDYFFIKFSNVFTKTAISNIYMGELMVFMFVSLGFFYLFVFLLVMHKIIIKFPLLPADKAFYMKNWTFSACVFPIIIYHIGMALIIFKSLVDLETTSSYSIKARLLHLAILSTTIVDRLTVSNARREEE